MKTKLLAGKKILSFVLAVTLMLSGSGIMAFAQDQDIVYGISSEAGSPVELEEGDGSVPGGAVTITAEPVVIPLGISYNLLQGVTAQDETGRKIPATVENDGGFDLDVKDTYTVRYAAEHPDNGERFEAERTVTVYPFHPQPQTIEEVRALIDAFEAALAEDGLDAAVAVRPRWQTQADESLLPAGWRCDSLEEVVGGVTVTYWSVFPTPANRAIVTNTDQLQAALNAPPVDGVILIGESFALTTNLTWKPTTDLPIILKSGAEGNQEVTLTSAPNNRHIVIDSRTGNPVLVFEDVVLEGGNASGGIRANSNAALTLRNAVIRNCVWPDGQGDGGGGAVLLNSGSLLLEGGELSGNSASIAGAIFAPTFTVTGAKILNNVCTAQIPNGGGALSAAAGSMTIIDSEVSGNTAWGDGGAIYMYAGTLKISGSELRNNTSLNGDGGAIGSHHVFGVEFEIDNSIISGNTAAGRAGGIDAMEYSAYSGKLTIEDSSINDNKAGYAGGIYSTVDTVIRGTEIVGNEASEENYWDPNHQQSGGGGIYFVPYSNVRWDPDYIKTLTIENYSTIKNNSAPYSDGGGIRVYISPDHYPIDPYEQLFIEHSTHFSENRARDLREGNPEWLYNRYHRIERPSVWSEFRHPLNNFDINYDGKAIPRDGYMVRYDVGHGISHNPQGPIVDVFILPGEQGIARNSWDLQFEPINPGFEFDCWRDEDTGRMYWPGEPLDPPMYQQELRLTAQWRTANVWIHYFNTEGIGLYGYGVQYLSEHIVKDISALPNIQIPAGREFEGWFDREDPTTTYRPGDTIVMDRNFQLEIKLRALQSTVTFELDRGSSSPYATKQVDTDQPFGENFPTEPYRTGYKFAGWEDVNGNEFTKDTVVSADMSVYARWELKSYTVRFDSNGGTPASWTETVDHGNPVAKPAQPTKIGHNFVDWYADSRLANVWDFTTPVTADITLYAKWEAVEYTVDFVDDGGSPVSPQQGVKHGEVVTRPGNPIKVGHDFVNWYTDASFATLWNFTTPITENTVIYAKWQQKVYTVTFNSQDGSMVSPVNAPYNTLITAPAAPSKSGYTFDGWYREAACITKWDFAADHVVGDITLYAKWTKSDFTVIYMVDGVEVNRETHLYGDTLTAPKAPTKPNHSFSGWYRENGTVWTFKSDKVQEDTVLHALFNVSGRYVFNFANRIEYPAGPAPDFSDVISKMNFRVINGATQITAPITITNLGFDKVNFSTPGNYKVRFIAKWVEGTERTMNGEVTIVVTPNAQPVISVLQDRVILPPGAVPAGEAALISLAGASAQDDLDGAVDVTVSFQGTTYNAINWNEPNEYAMFFKAKDSSGNETVRQKVSVLVVSGENL